MAPPNPRIDSRKQGNSRFGFSAPQLEVARSLHSTRPPSEVRFHRLDATHPKKRDTRVHQDTWRLSQCFRVGRHHTSTVWCSPSWFVSLIQEVSVAVACWVLHSRPLVGGRAGAPEPALAQIGIVVHGNARSTADEQTTKQQRTREHPVSWHELQHPM